MTKSAQYNVWSDGSYRQEGNRIGAGWVIRPPGDAAVIEAHKVLSPLQSAFRPHGSDVAEMSAVACALATIPAGSRVQLHVDCQNVIDWLNARSITTVSKAHITPLQRAFSSAVQSISTMQSVEIVKVSGNNFQHNAAHRLSRIASSAKPAK